MLSKSFNDYDFVNDDDDDGDNVHDAWNNDVDDGDDEWLWKHVKILSVGRRVKSGINEDVDDDNDDACNDDGDDECLC